MAELKYPDNHRYAKTDEWVRMDGEEAVIGITDYAQNALSDLVFIDLPSVGDTVKAGTKFGDVESTKAASELMSPVSGTITAVNNALEDTPEKINESPFDEAWMIKVKPTNPAELDALMDTAAYKEYCEKRG